MTEPLMSAKRSPCPSCGIDNPEPELFEAPLERACEACGWTIFWKPWAKTVKLHAAPARSLFDEDFEEPPTEEIVLTKPELVALRTYETQISTQTMH